jgi:hypothetical protein
LLQSLVDADHSAARRRNQQLLPEQPITPLRGRAIAGSVAGTFRNADVAWGHDQELPPLKRPCEFLKDGVEVVQLAMIDQATVPRRVSVGSKTRITSVNR